MNQDDNISEDNSLTEEHLYLIEFFKEARKNQIGFLEEAAKRIIELSTGMLGLFFAIVAFGKDFPPPYLQNNPPRQALAIFILAAFALAILAGVIAIQPRRYADWGRNLSGMREEYKIIMEHKTRGMQIATWMFFAGTALLAVFLAGLVGTA